MMEPPKFTQPLTDRITTRGYNTHLICCVRGFPQVRGSSVGSIASACGQPPMGVLKGGWRCWRQLVMLGWGWMKLWGCSCPLSQTRANVGCFCVEMRN